MTTRTPNGAHAPHVMHHPQAAVITSARDAASTELSGRVRRYTLAMAFRMACFLAMIVVDGWLRWVLLAVAVFMPYLAVVLANQADQRSSSPFGAFVPGSATAITAGPATTERSGALPSEVIEGEIVGGDLSATAAWSQEQEQPEEPVRQAA